ncbi:MAG: hypothetical protein PQJ50_10580, partial [Spirochaetales bacterium]|nr:hypothetical protein [Spirochaetales bacterium]
MNKAVYLTPLMAAIILSPLSGQDTIVTETISYRAGGTELVGYLAYDSSIKGKRPGIVVVHEWTGINDYARFRAR